MELTISSDDPALPQNTALLDFITKYQVIKSETTPKTACVK